MSEILIKIQLSAAIILLGTAFVCMFLRRAVFWAALGLSMGIKAIILGSLVALHLLPTESGKSLVFLVLVGLSMLMIGVVVSFAVVIRAQRFSGELDWEKEIRMRH